MTILKRETGGLEPRPQGSGGGHGKLGRLQDWIRLRMDASPDLALEIADAHQVTVHRVSVWRVLRGLGRTHKKRPVSRRAKAA